MTGPVAVTGATGFLGSALIARLCEDGRRIRLLLRRPPPDLPSGQVMTVDGDVRDAAATVRLVSGCDTVFHLAALRRSPGPTRDLFHDVNVAAAVALVEASVAARVRRFVLVSTAQVFGPSHDVPLDEASPLKFAGDPYAVSRAVALERIEALSGRGTEIAVVLPSIVFGPDQRSHRNRVTNHLRRLLRSRACLSPPGPPARRSLAFRNDVVEGILSAEQVAISGSRRFILAGEDITMDDLNTRTRLLAGRSPGVQIRIPGKVLRAGAVAADRLRGFPSDSGYAAALQTLLAEWRYDDSRARHELGYRPTPVNDALLTTIDFLTREALG